MCARYLMVFGLIAALSILSGCGPTMLERNWGRSFESARFNQILNPEAGKNLDPVVELDGRAAETNMEKYRKGFELEAYFGDKEIFEKLEIIYPEKEKK